jgi:hypothetical protein
MERAIADEAFAARLRTDRESVISEYDLTEDEQQALRSKDPAKMEALGVDRRISKAFEIE